MTQWRLRATASLQHSSSRLQNSEKVRTSLTVNVLPPPQWVQVRSILQPLKLMMEFNHSSIRKGSKTYPRTLLRTLSTILILSLWMRIVQTQFSKELEVLKVRSPLIKKTQIKSKLIPVNSNGLITAMSHSYPPKLTRYRALVQIKSRMRSRPSYLRRL